MVVSDLISVLSDLVHCASDVLHLCVCVCACVYVCVEWVDGCGSLKVLI